MRKLDTKKTANSAARTAKKKSARASNANSILRDANQFLMPTYKRQPIVFTHGRGAYVYDSRGKKYLDFLGGIAVNALGHAHPRIVKVIRRESARAIHLSNLFHNSFQGPLARKLAEWSGLDRVFFANSGTEAITIAFKDALLAPSASLPRRNTARHSLRWFREWSSSSSMTSPTWNRNSTTRFV